MAFVIKILEDGRPDQVTVDQVRAEFKEVFVLAKKSGVKFAPMNIDEVVDRAIAEAICSATTPEANDADILEVAKSMRGGF